MTLGVNGDPTAEYWRAQALASLGRTAEALAIYQKVANSSSAIAPEAGFGEAEMLRILNRDDEAIARYSMLFRDPRIGSRAQLQVADIVSRPGRYHERLALIEQGPNEYSGGAQGAAFSTWSIGADFALAGEGYCHLRVDFEASSRCRSFHHHGGTVRNRGGASSGADAG